tara:strand:+ start:1380 stop:1484 length:105 start_codon:yes stop_codon:yes gene_type:complete
MDGRLYEQERLNKIAMEKQAAATASQVQGFYSRS